jgi:prevent-host-death family protein
MVAMTTVNIHEAKTHLSRLIARVARGESFVIARAGKPLARVIPIEAKDSPAKRLGFMKGEMAVPKDFDEMGRDEIATLFGSAKCFSRRRRVKALPS